MSADRVFVTTGGSNVSGGTLYEVDPSDGSIMATIGPTVDGDANAYNIGAIAIDSLGQMWGYTDHWDPSPSGPGTMCAIDKATGIVAPIGSYDFQGYGWNVSGIAFDDADNAYVCTNLSHASANPPYGGPPWAERWDKTTGAFIPNTLGPITFALPPDAPWADNPSNSNPHGLGYDSASDTFYFCGYNQAFTYIGLWHWDYQPRMGATPGFDSLTSVRIGDTGIPLLLTNNTMMALACGGNTVIYAVASDIYDAAPFPAQLYTIDKTTGTATLVGDLPVNTSGMTVIPGSSVNLSLDAAAVTVSAPFPSLGPVLPDLNPNLPFSAARVTVSGAFRYAFGTPIAVGSLPGTVASSTRRKRLKLF